MCEAEALVLAGEDPIAVGGRDQLERQIELVVGVLERALGDPQRERRSGVLSRSERRARVLEHRTRLLVAARGDEIVEEGGEVAGAQGLRKVGQVQGEASSSDPDL